MQTQSLPIFLEYFDKVHQRTMRVARCVPAGKLEWTYKDGKFTLGDLLRHIACINRYMFAETIRNRPSRYSGCGRELADGRDEVLAFVERLHIETAAIIAQLSDADLNAKCATPEGAQITVWKWLRLMIEHEIHHRGQIYLYLAMLGVETPPLYGLTSEQVRERSVTV